MTAGSAPRCWKQSTAPSHAYPTTKQWQKYRPLWKSAGRFVQTVRWTDEATTVRTVGGLPSAPYLFRSGRVRGSRECVVHPNYLVIYQVGTDSIDVLRVLHARQEYP